jgi:hypothetical protein
MFEAFSIASAACKRMVSSIPRIMFQGHAPIISINCGTQSSTSSKDSLTFDHNSEGQGTQESHSPKT